MTRARLCLVALLVSAFVPFVASTAHASGLTCSNPTTVTGNQGTLHLPPYVYQNDDWSGAGSTTGHVCSASDWEAIVNQTGDPATGVKTYPDSQKTYTDWASYCGPAWSSFPKWRMKFGEVVPGGTPAWDAGADIFLGGGSCGTFREIMVLPNSRNVDFPTPTVSNVTIGTTVYNVYYNADGSFVQFYNVTKTDSGTIHLKQLFNWLAARGLVSPSDKVRFAAYGFEVLTTYGADVPFDLTNFAVIDA